MAEIRIRERQPSDLDGCVEALRAVQQADGYPVAWPADPARWLSPAGSPGAWVAVAEADVVVGHVLVQSVDGEAAVVEVGRLFVAPGARGNSLGARLLDRVRTWAAERGVGLVLEVTADQRSGAIALYERTGWRRVDTYRADWTAPDGAPVTLHRYVLQPETPVGQVPARRTCPDSRDTGGHSRRMSFDAAASTYRRGRPPYPEAVFDLLADRCGLRPGTRVLEVGAGTGLATGPLLAAGADVVAVEPGRHLAAVLAATHGCDRLEIEVADFETAELTGGFDLAVAATALHWLDPVESTRRLGELVRPGGWLAAWWNEFGDTNRPTTFRDRLDAVYHDLLPAEPGYRDSRSHVLDTDRWRRQLTAGGLFDGVAVEIVEWQQILTPQSARDLWSTFPNIAELAPSDREQFLTRLASLVEDEGGQVADPRLTVVYTAVRTGG